MSSDSGHKRRRQLLKGITAGGTALLAGCLGSGKESSGSGNQLKFVHISSFANDMESLGPIFRKQTSNINLNTTTTTASSSTSRRYYTTQLVSQSANFDVGMMDVIWPAFFVENDWVVDINDSDNMTSQMMDTPVRAMTIDDMLYGMPMYTDANAFYYRSDKLEEYGHDVPETYTEVVNVAQDILNKDDEITNGYIWQGGSNEGLTIMWLNWLWGMGGTVQHNDKLKVNTQKGIDALGHAVDLIHKYEITPRSAAASKTDGNRQTFQQGNTLFMRMWPYAVAVMNEDGSPVKDKFSVTQMPTQEGHTHANNSCLGGWGIMINEFSENKEAAQQFAQFVATKEVQEALALNHSRLPVRQDLYTQEYFDQAPLLEKFANILNQTRARPTTPNYSTFSEIVYSQCNSALVQNKTPKKALNDAQKQIDQQINNA